MRVVAFAMLIACSSKTEDKAKPVEPPVAQKATPVCPKSIDGTQHPWAHEVFPGCPAPQARGFDVPCGDDCRPCRLQIEHHGTPATRTIEYDGRRRYVGARDDRGFLHACEYDAAGLVRCRDTQRSFRIERDARGRISRVIDQDDAEISRFAYDDRGLPVEVTDAIVGTSTLVWDANGRLEREVVPGDAIVYHYDASGRVTHFDATTFRPDRYTYDAAGKLVEKTYFEVRIVYAYDTKHRL